MAASHIVFKMHESKEPDIEKILLEADAFSTRIEKLLFLDERYNAVRYKVERISLIQTSLEPDQAEHRIDKAFFNKAKSIIDDYPLDGEEVDALIGFACAEDKEGLQRYISALSVDINLANKKIASLILSTYQVDSKRAMQLGKALAFLCEQGANIPLAVSFFEIHYYQEEVNALPFWCHLPNALHVRFIRRFNYERSCEKRRLAAIKQRSPHLLPDFNALSNAAIAIRELMLNYGLNLETAYTWFTNKETPEEQLKYLHYYLELKIEELGAHMVVTDTNIHRHIFELVEKHFADDPTLLAAAIKVNEAGEPDNALSSILHLNPAFIKKIEDIISQEPGWDFDTLEAVDLDEVREVESVAHRAARVFDMREVNTFIAIKNKERIYTEIYLGFKRGGHAPLKVLAHLNDSDFRKYIVEAYIKDDPVKAREMLDQAKKISELMKKHDLTFDDAEIGLNLLASVLDEAYRFTDPAERVAFLTKHLPGESEEEPYKRYAGILSRLGKQPEIIRYINRDRAPDTVGLATLSVFNPGMRGDGDREASLYTLQ